ncbi:MAG TPA: hypothetical protein VE077_03565 [Candidatus Methylomirabilis sp.]|nr:hypothetical protein [Candidatus Methylomirabilis sp.]
MNTRKRILLSFVAFFLISSPLFGQDATSKKLVTLSGTIGAGGTTFLSDEDQQIWKVSNPAALRGKEGRHAKLKFCLAPGSEEVFVTSVKLIQDQTVVLNRGDSAFRR